MDIKEKIRQFLMEELKQLSGNGEVEYLEDDTPLIDNGVIDSLMILNLLAFLEQNFSVFLSKERFDPEHFGTVQKISDLVVEKMAHG